MNPRAALALISAMVVSILGTPGIGETQGFLSLLFGNSIFVRLDGYEEAPLVISTTGNGVFTARINQDQSIDYTLSYADLEGSVQQAHIHFGLPSVTGGIVVFLCTNLGNGPAGTKACPASPATIEGTIHPADVLAVAAQGFEAGAFGELLAAIRNGATYVNIHSTKWPGGEIRAQLTGSKQHLFGNHD